MHGSRIAVIGVLEAAGGRVGWWRLEGWGGVGLGGVWVRVRVRGVVGGC